MPSILILNGPNLNLLGTREPHLYGSTTLRHIEDSLKEIGAKNDVQVDTFQSNHEGQLVDRIHAARENKTDAIVINAGAYTHTSIAIRDALAGVAIPFIEVHITNVHARESFRAHSYLSDKARACVVGSGVYGYEAAVNYAMKELAKRD